MAAAERPASTAERAASTAERARGALSTWDGLSQVPREEIRFGVVLNGGVSLAVWMGGGVLELDRLIKAAQGRDQAPAYSLLLSLAGASARADVIAGTSAGGINGSALALAQVNRRADVSLLRDIWIEQGQLETLLRQPFRGSPSSLMKGDEYFLPQLNAALARLAAPAELVEPDEAPIDLTIATTVLNGNQLVTSDALGQQLPQSLHAAKFRWKRWPNPGPDDVDPFSAGRIRATAARLALASRASASFPVAFEPTYVPVFSEDTTRSPEDRAVRPDMGEVVESWGMPLKRDRSRFAVDGGLLANTPTTYALSAIEAMPASGPVRRVMLLVYPHAPEPGLDPADQFTAPPTLRATMTGLLGALSSQGGRTLVEELEVHNRQAAGRRGTRSDVLGTLVDTGQTLESIATDLFPHYRRLRKWRAARDLAQRKVDQFASLPMTSAPAAAAWGYDRVRTAAARAQEWLDLAAARSQPATSATPAAAGMSMGLPYVPDALPTEAEPDTGPGWGWGVTGASSVAEAAGDLLRRMVWVMPRGPAYDTVAHARRAVSDLAADIESSRSSFDEAWDTQEVLLGLEPSQSYWAFRLGCYRTLMTGADATGLEQLSIQISENEGAAAFEATGDPAERTHRSSVVLQALNNQWGSCADRAGEAGAVVRRLVDGVVDATLPALALLPGLDLTQTLGFSDARLGSWSAVLCPQDHTPTHDQLLTRLLQLQVTNSALGDEVSTGSTIPVEIIQLSAQTQNAFTRYTRTADDKLGGMSINRFGGFLKRSWRVNDWVWGRLDAATILCRTVLHPTRVRRTGLLSGYLQPTTAHDEARDLAEETLQDLLGRLFGPDGVPGDAAIQELVPQAVKELTEAFDVAGVAAGDLPTSMPALAHLFALAVQLDVVPQDLLALTQAIAADATDGASARSRSEFFVRENADLIKRLTEPGRPVEPQDRGRLLVAFDRAGIGREPLEGEASSDLMLRAGTTAAAVGSTVLDSPRSGLAAIKPLTRGLRGAMLFLFWGMTALTGKGVIARSLALLALAMGAVLVTLAAFGAVPAGLDGLAAAAGISLLLLAFAYGALRSGTMLHSLVLLTPLVPVLAEAFHRQSATSGGSRDTVTLVAVIVLALGLMAIGTLPAATGSVVSSLQRLADRQHLPPLPPGSKGSRGWARGALRALRGVAGLLVAIGCRLLVLLVPLGLALWVIDDSWEGVIDWLAAHQGWCWLVAAVCAALGTVAATHFGNRLRVLAADRAQERVGWRWLRVAHPAGVSASWSVVYGTAYLLLALLLIGDPWDWRGQAWSGALCATSILFGLVLTLVVPVAVPVRAFTIAQRAEIERARKVPPFVATAADFNGHTLAEITPEQSYACDLVQRDVAYRCWVSYQPDRGVGVPGLSRMGQHLLARLPRPD